MMNIFHSVSEKCSEITTKNYSTSFSSAILLLDKDIRTPIYNIYGFVRLADEIVDTFHQFDKATLLGEFRNETWEAISRGISTNPILHSFQRTVHEYNIDHELIESFFRSMEMDLTVSSYEHTQFDEYVYGSAEVVGLMCLHVFCGGDRKLYSELKRSARALGAAFQKVNFIRDIRSDYLNLSRMYFPGCDFTNFTEGDKERIVNDISKDFSDAYEGIMKLPLKARFGVYVAYKYYYSLFRKIKKLNTAKVLRSRIRIPNYGKLMIIVRAGVKNKMGMIG